MRNIFLFTLFLVFGLTTGFGRELYRTDFDAFSTGQGAWTGTEGWLTTGASGLASGISDSALADLGNTAYLGFHQPESTFNLVYRDFNFDPLAAGEPILLIETILGVQDSTNGQRDQFFIGIRNRAGAFLAGIGFDNRDATGSGVNPITRLDGQDRFSTAENFDRNELHILYLEINFAANTWSAELDGLFPIFTDAPFSNSGADLDFGFLSYEWQLSSASVSGHGDNFLLVGDLIVDAAPVGTSPFEVDIEHASASECSLSFLAEPGFQYDVEFAAQAGGPFQRQPGSRYADIASVRRLDHLEISAFSSRRFYRIRRSVQP